MGEQTPPVTDVIPADPAAESNRKGAPCWTPSPRVLTAAVLLFTAVSFSHAWNAWTRAARFTEPFLHGDALAYVAMMRTGDPAAVAGPYRYRPLTPWMAGLVPPPPAWLLAAPRQLSDDQVAVMRFALVNAVGVTLAASFLFMLLARLGFGPWEVLTGSLFLLVGHRPAGAAMNPLVDAWGFGLLAAGLWGLLARRWEIVALAFALGLFNHESIVLVPVAALLLRGWSTRDRWMLAACFVPVALGYVGFRFLLFPAEDPVNPLHWYPAWGRRLFASQEILAIPKDLFKSFGLLWIPALVGWARVEPGSPLARLRLLIPLVLLAPFVLIKGMSRTWFYLFPVIIPLALLGIRAWLARWGASPNGR